MTEGSRAEPPRPEAIAQHDNAGCLGGAVVRRIEQPTSGGSNAVDRKVARGNLMSEGSLRTLIEDHTHRFRKGLVGGDIDQRSGVRQVPIGRERNLVDAKVVALADVYQAIGIQHACWRLDEQVLRHGEHGGVQPNPEGNRGDGGKSEQRGASQCPQAEA